jgi:rsbT co-antagonist protein RsbR
MTTVLDGSGSHDARRTEEPRGGHRRQQQEMLELSTPVVTLWDGVLALPLIGTLDSARTQVVMESLLQRIVDSGARSRSSTSPACRPSDTLVASTC